MAWRELVLLGAEFSVYYAAMLLLFRFRHLIGLGAFFCALGSLHFLENYLATSLYVQFYPGMSLSPGSVVLFSGKLLLLLLVYIREDAPTVRQPIYGLLLGNFLAVALLLILRHHQVLAPVEGQQLDLALLNDVGGLMVWGSLLLFIDCLMIILVYEFLGDFLRAGSVLRLWLSASAVLIFDQIGFFAALNLLLGVPFSAGLGGLIGKLGAAGFYSLLIAGYLRWVETSEKPAEQRRLGDVFDILTYR
ncbi:MAG TPA: hypothetical protein VFS04_12600 [Alphaproteobacteria bacterium]|nr:hypothetical protein [Alphaproteobacteria bacterium]